MKQICCLFFVLSFTLTYAQYDPQKIFVTDLFTHAPNPYRSANGSPGPDYWQNKADYTITADFDTKNNILSGEVTIDYTNNSPDQLHFLWLQLDQNTASKEAKVNKMRQPGVETADKGYHIEKVMLKNDNKSVAADYKISGTRMQVRLKHPLAAGAAIKLTIAYRYELLKKGGGERSGIFKQNDIAIYEFSYWYPRMCVYDDYNGWNTLPFIGGGEMYLDYGDIDYKLTVPADQVVVGAGVLVNGKEILNKKTLRRIRKASHSEKTVMIRSAKELDEPVTKAKTGKVTWHFKMENTRDVAWAMSDDFIWDAVNVNLSDGRTALAQSVFPVISTEEGRAWERSTEMLKGSLEFFSDFLFDYPYHVATSVAGPVGGMEFPGLTFDYWDLDESGMFLLTAHEIGHTWFPMVVGSNERRHPFMDEGFNTFLGIYVEDWFNNGEFAPKRDGEYAAGGGKPADEIVQVIADAQGGPTLMTPADDQDYKYVHPLSYFKSAFGLVLLREVILGQDEFDYAFKRYALDWSYKHPQPEDFFRRMNNASGEDLTWFWNGWYYHNWQLNQGIKTVTYVEDNPRKGGIVTLVNTKQMVMPVLLTVTETNGEVHHLKIPVDIWKFGGSYDLKLPTTSKIKSLVLDKEHQLPDTDRSDNVWKTK